nr:hypothetical protein CFP56_09256 [Quercus suber]
MVELQWFSLLDCGLVEVRKCADLAVAAPTGSEFGEAWGRARVYGHGRCSVIRGAYVLRVRRRRAMTSGGGSGGGGGGGGGDDEHHPPPAKPCTAGLSQMRPGARRHPTTTDDFLSDQRNSNDINEPPANQDDADLSCASHLSTGVSIDVPSAQHLCSMLGLAIPQSGREGTSRTPKPMLTVAGSLAVASRSVKAGRRWQATPPRWIVRDHPCSPCHPVRTVQQLICTVTVLSSPPAAAAAPPIPPRRVLRTGADASSAPSGVVQGEGLCAPGVRARLDCDSILDSTAPATPLSTTTPTDGDMQNAASNATCFAPRPVAAVIRRSRPSRQQLSKPLWPGKRKRGGRQCSSAATGPATTEHAPEHEPAASHDSALTTQSALFGDPTRCCIATFSPSQCPEAREPPAPDPQALRLEAANAAQLVKHHETLSRPWSFRPPRQSSPSFPPILVRDIERDSESANSGSIQRRLFAISTARASH